MILVVNFLKRSNGVSSFGGFGASTKSTMAFHGRLFNSFHLKAHHATDATTRINRILSLECQNIEPHAPKTPEIPWKIRTGSNTVIAKTAISIAIQSTALMSNFTPQSQNESTSKLKTESENRHEAEEKAMGIDEGRISQLRARLRIEELFHALIRNQEWLASLAKTSDDLKAYRELLDRWQADGYPDLESWLAKGSPAPSRTIPAQATDSISHS